MSNKYFYVAKADGRYYYFGIDFYNGHHRLWLGTVDTVFGLSAIKQSEKWKESKLRNYNRLEFPLGINLRHGEVLEDTELEKILENAPTSQELENMFKV